MFRSSRALSRQAVSVFAIVGLLLGACSDASHEGGEGAPDTGTYDASSAPVDVMATRDGGGARLEDVSSREGEGGAAEDVTLGEDGDLVAADSDAPCIPQCDGAECGEDGCGGACGECADDEVCELQLCAPACQPEDVCDTVGTGVCTDDGGALLVCVELSPGCLGFNPPSPCPEGTHCVEGLCTSPCVPDCVGKACGGDGCGGQCGDGCDDDNPCTDDACEPSGTCVHVPNVVACDDGDPCTEGDVCQAGGCAPGGNKDCDDGEPCTTESCVAGEGCSIVPLEDGVDCESGDLCLSAEVCLNGVCSGGSPLVCSDEDPCTEAGCEPEVGCVYPPLFEGCEPVEVSCQDGLDNDQDAAVDCEDSDCVAACCADGVQSGQETGVDCGGACLACPGEACQESAECASGWCGEEGACATPKTYYWVGGSGLWTDYENHWATSSGGEEFHSSVPTFVDDVVFDAASFPEAGGVVTLDMLVATCRHMDWSGATGAPSLVGEPGKELVVTGNLSLNPGMQWSAQTDIRFTGPGGHLIDTQGVSIAANNAFIDDVHGQWTLASPFVAPNVYLHVVSGTFDTGGYDLTLRRLLSDNQNPRAIRLNDSTINLWQYWFMSSTENLTFDAGTSTIIWSASNTLRFEGGDATFYALEVNVSGGEVELSGDMRFSHITKAGPGELEVTGALEVSDAIVVQEGTLTLSANTNIEALTLAPGTFWNLGSGQTQMLGSLEAVGNCTEYITIHATSPGSQAALSVAEGQVGVVYGAIRDIAASGGAEFFALKTYDEGGNSGWTIEEPEPKSYYWIGGSGNWSDPNHWSTESGGEPAECFRGSSDSVYFDENSFSEGSSTVTLDVPETTCHHMDWTGAGFSPTLAGSGDHHLTVTGDLTLVAGLNWSASGDLWLRGPGQKTLTSHAVNIGAGELHIDGAEGSWALGDSLTTTNGYLFVDRGAFDTAGYDMTIRRFISDNDNVRTISLQSSTINLWQYWFMSNTTNLTFDAGTSTIIWSASNTLRFEGGAATFHDLEVSVSGGEVDIRGASTFRRITKAGIGALAIEDPVSVQEELHVTQGTLALRAQTTLQSLTLEPGVALVAKHGMTQTLGALSADGTCGQRIRLESDQAGQPATLSVDAGAVTLSHCVIGDVTAAGGASFTVTDALDVGGNSGWEFSEASAQDYYWVGGSGSWSQPGVWALESGGEPTECAPSRRDSAIFDAASFDGPGAIVTLDLPLAECHDMRWSGVAHQPSVQGGQDNQLTVYGDFVLSPAMSWGATGDILLTGSGDKSIDGQGVPLGAYAMRLDELGATWTLKSPLVLQNGYLFVERGGFDTASEPLTVRRFISDNGNLRSVSLGASTVNLKQYWFMANTTNLTFDAGTSTIVWAASNTIRFEGGDATFYALEASVGSGSIKVSGPTEFASISKLGDGELSIEDGITVSGGLKLMEGSLTLKGESSLGALELQSGIILRLQAETTQSLGALTGTFTGVTTIFESTSPGTQATLALVSDAEVCLSHTQLSDIAVMGGGGWYASDSIDGGNNSGLTFGPCP